MRSRLNFTIHNDIANVLTWDERKLQQKFLCWVVCSSVIVCLFRTFSLIAFCSRVFCSGKCWSICFDGKLKWTEGKKNDLEFPLQTENNLKHCEKKLGNWTKLENGEKLFCCNSQWDVNEWEVLCSSSLAKIITDCYQFSESAYGEMEKIIPTLLRKKNSICDKKKLSLFWRRTAFSLYFALLQINFHYLFKLRVVKREWRWKRNFLFFYCFFSHG